MDDIFLIIVSAFLIKNKSIKLNIAFRMAGKQHDFIMQMWIHLENSNIFLPKGQVRKYFFICILQCIIKLFNETIILIVESILSTEELYEIFPSVKMTLFYYDCCQNSKVNRSNCKKINKKKKNF